MFIFEDVKLFSQHIKTVKVCGKEGGGVEMRERELICCFYLLKATLHADCLKWSGLQPVISS